ncbi:unnamed protein product [Prorocentrum cordatum]|uniref:Uncharacterized protein n=1 Tax=Prorocentrum cordatum TaxID=2364126 RepID=A0ABN9VC66_9DINO|nr:unnamed protein product [Polarella glacialis]
MWNFQGARAFEGFMPALYVGPPLLPAQVCAGRCYPARELAACMCPQGSSVDDSGTRSPHAVPLRAGTLEHLDWDAPEWRALLRQEAVYLDELRAWDQHNIAAGAYRERTDKFEKRASATEAAGTRRPLKVEDTMPRVLRMQRAKASTNRAVAGAAAESARSTSGSGGEATALVLDGAEAGTASVLLAAGFQRGRVLIPNLIPSVAESLRNDGSGGFACAAMVEDYVLGAPPVALDLAYLDFTGAFPRRAPHLRALFERGWLRPGGVLACTFSTREGPWQPGDGDAGAMPPGWSQAHAAYALVRVLLGAARESGLRLEGPDLEGSSDPSCEYKRSMVRTIRLY